MRFADLLVDLAAVASASRSVASKHVALRARQVDRYGKTSSIVAAAKEYQGGQGRNEGKPRSQQDAASQSHEQGADVAAETEGNSEAAASRESPKESLRESTAAMEKAEGKGTTQVSSPPSSPNPPSQKPKFVPAPWADGTPLATAFPPPRKPPLPFMKGMGPKDFVVGGVGPAEVPINAGKKILSMMEALEAAAAEVLRQEEEQVAREKEAREKDAKEKGRETDMAASIKAEGSARVKAEDSQVGGLGKSSKVDSPVAATISTKSNEYIPESPKAALSQADADLVADLTGSNIPPSAPRYELRESRVPSSRIGRLWNYGGLAAGMFAGAIGEGLSRAVGGGSQGSMMLSPANMERLVAKLSRMRGAALKLGQMMSFQDAKMLPAPIQEVLQRVQDRADYMPAWQRDRVLTSNLGPNWRDLFGEFEEKPIAAASIGQVHKATLKSTGARVAVKIQFPGVADSINSDLDNIAILLTATKLLPKGLYLNKTIDNARTELAWECDYEREAECGIRYRKLLTSPDTHQFNDVFVVPTIYPEASGKQVITMEFMDGVGVTRIKDFTQAQKDWIGTQILRLCLREITEFKFMQTDPNWTNFLYNPQTSKLELLDFGASREFPDVFIHQYIRLLEAASRADRDLVKSLSEDLGYLTGHESKAMLDAHIISVSTLAEPFLRSAPEVYDFSDQTITERVKEQIPVMIHERLAPPPEETYSLHRKLSGAFLLCARLGSRVRCRELFEDALEKTGIKFP